MMSQTRTELEQGGSGVKTPEWFNTWCPCLGMTPAAPKAWGLILTKPHIACFISILANLSAASTSFVFIFASQPYRWFHHSVAVVWATFSIVIFTMSWRLGPLLPGPTQLLFIGCFSTCIAAYQVTVLWMMFGPEEHCVFQSRIALAFIDSLYICSVSTSAFFGLWPPDIPKSPYRYVSLL